MPLVVDAAPRRPLGVPAQDVVWLDDAIAPSEHRDVDGTRYGFYRLERAAMDLADAWAVGAVERLQRAGLLPPYHGVDLGPILACWLYYRFRADAMACVRLARVLEVEPAAPSAVITGSRVRASLFAQIARAHGLDPAVVREAGSSIDRVTRSVRPLARAARDQMRRVARDRERSAPQRPPRLLFVSHHPTVRPRVRPVLEALVRRGWSISVVNVEGGPPADETVAVRELAYGDFVARGRAIARISRYVAALRRGMRAGDIARDLPATVALPADSWTAAVQDAVYTVVSEIEITQRVLDEAAADVVMYSNRSGLGTLTHGVAAARGVPSVLIQLTESFWDDDFRHCRADLFTAMGQMARERLLKAGAEPDRVIVTGSDHYFEDPGFDAARARAKVCADLGLAPLSPRDKLVLLVSQNREFLNPDPYRRFVYASVLGMLRALPEARVVVKLHPRETDALTRECFAGLPSTTCAVTPDYRLSTLLEAADAVVIMWSTVGLQAVARGRPVVVINYKGDGPVVPCAIEGAALSVEEPEALTGAVKTALHDEAVRADLRRRGTKFLERYLSPNDGRAAERIADAVGALAAGRRGA